MTRYTDIARQRIHRQNVVWASGWRAGLIPVPGYPLRQQPSRKLCSGPVEDFCYMSGLRAGQREQRRKLRSGEMVMRDGLAVFQPLPELTARKAA